MARDRRASSGDSYADSKGFRVLPLPFRYLVTRGSLFGVPGTEEAVTGKHGGMAFLATNGSPTTHLPFCCGCADAVAVLMVGYEWGDIRVARRPYCQPCARGLFIVGERFGWAMDARFIGDAIH